LRAAPWEFAHKAGEKHTEAFKRNARPAAVSPASERDRVSVRHILQRLCAKRNFAMQFLTGATPLDDAQASMQVVAAVLFGVRRGTWV